MRILEISLATFILLCPRSTQTWGKKRFSKILNFQGVHTGVFVSHCRIHRKLRHFSGKSLAVSTLPMTEVQNGYQRAPQGMTDPTKYRFNTLGQKMTSQVESNCKKNEISNLVQYLKAVMKARVSMKRKCD